MMHKNLCICDNCKKEIEVKDSYDNVWIHVVGHDWFKIGFNNADLAWHGERLDFCCLKCYKEFFVNIFDKKEQGD